MKPLNKVCDLPYSDESIQSFAPQGSGDTVREIHVPGVPRRPGVLVALETKS